MARKFSLVSLFTGAGGLDCGFERTGRFDLLAAVELVPEFCETLRLNQAAGHFGSHKTQIIEADLGTLAPTVLMDKLGIAPGELDVLIGGPPCQSFSTAGRRRTVQDPRGELLWAFMDYVLAFQPKVFVLENVRGLLSAALRHRPIAERPNKGGPPIACDEEPGSAIAAWVEDLVVRSEGKYRLDCFEVNAVNHGAPQLRERAVLVGNRLGKSANWPAPSHGTPETPFRTLRDALEGLDDPAPALLDFSPRKKKYLGMVPPGGNWRTLPVELQQESMGRAWHAKGGRSGWWRRLSWDLPCPTVTTMPNHASTAMCHPDEVRVLSVAEYAAVQEFPADWQFAGNVAAQYKQVGNAVPSRLGEVAGEVVTKILTSRAAAQPNLPPYQRVYVDSHVRTRQWFKAGEVFVWNETEQPRYGATSPHT